MASYRSVAPGPGTRIFPSPTRTQAASSTAGGACKQGATAQWPTSGACPVYRARHPGSPRTPTGNQQAWTEVALLRVPVARNVCAGHMFPRTRRERHGDPDPPGGETDVSSQAGEPIRQASRGCTRRGSNEKGFTQETLLRRILRKPGAQSLAQSQSERAPSRRTARARVKPAGFTPPPRGVRRACRRKFARVLFREDLAEDVQGA